MYHLVAGLCSQPAQPVAAVSQSEPKCLPPPGSRWQVFHQLPRQHLLVLMWVRLKHDCPPLLASHVEHASQLAREQTTVAFGNRSQKGEPSRHGVQCTLVYAHYALGEAPAPPTSHPAIFCQHAADLLEEPLQWLGPRAMPLVDRLVCNQKSKNQSRRSERRRHTASWLPKPLRTQTSSEEPLRAGRVACQGPRGGLAPCSPNMLKELLYVPDGVWSPLLVDISLCPSFALV